MVAGSIDSARRTGQYAASAAVATSSAGAVVKLTASHTLTPNTTLRSDCANTALAMSPTAAPPSAGRNPAPTTSDTTDRGDAPTATRIPISRDRCATMTASSPKRPPAASTNANTANAATT